MDRHLTVMLRQGRCYTSCLASALKTSRLVCFNSIHPGGSVEELAKPSNRIAQRISQGRAELLESNNARPPAWPLTQSYQPGDFQQGNVEELSRLVELLPTDIQNTLREREDFHLVGPRLLHRGVALTYPLLFSLRKSQVVHLFCLNEAFSRLGPPISIRI
jgi:hypothetical protein